MRSTTAALVFTLSLAEHWTRVAAATSSSSSSSSSAEESGLFPRAVSGDGYLSVPVAMRKTLKNVNPAQKRAGDIAVTLKNEIIFYGVEVGLGTPPQMVTILLDTGSSELWVNPDCSSAQGLGQMTLCQAFGQYDPAKSKTPPIGPFGGEKLSYGDPSDASTVTSVTLKYYLDNVSFGNAQIKNQTFGVVQSSNGMPSGIMGMAPDVHGGFAGTQPYSLLLNTMVEQGVIASRVFALDLRHSDSGTGAIIFGGLDRNKFIGSLTRRPLVQGNKGEYRLAVNVDTFGLTQGTPRSFQLVGDDTSFVLDSGTTISRMHADAAMPILEALNYKTDGQGNYYALCGLRKSTSTVDFGFGNTTIHVPFSDFIIGDDSARDDQYCLVGLDLTTDQQILGDTVLRAGYFVFDWDNQEVHLGQAANCGNDDIVAVGKGKNSVPDVQGNCKQSDVASSSTSAPSKSTNRPTVANPSAQPTGKHDDKSASTRPDALSWTFTVFASGLLGVVCHGVLFALGGSE